LQVPYQQSNENQYCKIMPDNSVVDDCEVTPEEYEMIASASIFGGTSTY
jgi:hypothetical protein